MPGKSRADKAAARQSVPKDAAETDQQVSSLNDSLEENTKDTGQEKDAGTSKGQDGKASLKETGVMDSPRYLRSPRDKSQERSSSPFRRNVVEPLPASGTAAGTSANQGSLASLRSGASSASRGGVSFCCCRNTGNVLVHLLPSVSFFQIYAA